MRAATDSPSVDMYKAAEPVRRGLAGDADAGSARRDQLADSGGSADPGNYVHVGRGRAGVRSQRDVHDAAYPAPPGTGQGHLVGGLRPAVSRSALDRLQGAVHDRNRDDDGVDDGLRRVRRSATASTAAIRPPDATITTDTPGSGVGRLQLVSENGTMYRVLVTSRPEYDYALPSAPEAARHSPSVTTTATLRFIAPGDDGLVGKVLGYEVRYSRQSRPLTAENFADAMRRDDDGHARRARQPPDARPDRPVAGDRLLRSAFARSMIAATRASSRSSSSRRPIASSARSMRASSRPRRTAR